MVTERIQLPPKKQKLMGETAARFVSIRWSSVIHHTQIESNRIESKTNGREREREENSE